MSAAVVDLAIWEARRARAEELRAAWPFAAEVLGFYIRILSAQQQAYVEACTDAPAAHGVAAYVAQRVLPRIIETSAESGPVRLVQGALERFHEADVEELIESWLRGGEMRSVDRFLARASCAPVLEALGLAAGDACEGPRDERHCPYCGGAPLLSVFSESGENLVTARRMLDCARCSYGWPFARMVCPNCGENDSERLSIYRETERPMFPHLRIEGCKSCNHYLVNVDRTKDGRAVPVVDEIAAIPLGLYAKGLGYSKAVPNLMEF